MALLSVLSGLRPSNLQVKATDAFLATKYATAIVSVQDLPSDAAAYRFSIRNVRIGEAVGQEAGQIYGVTGQVLEQGISVARTVRVYRRDTGQPLASGVSAQGRFSLTWTGYNGPVTVLAFDDDSDVVYNCKVLDRVIPV